MGKLKGGIGCWRYSKPQPTIADPLMEGANSGCYGIFDHAPTQGPEYFLKYGFADAKVNAFSASLAAGAVWHGFGIGIAKVFLGGDERSARAAAGADPAAEETAYELTYRHELTEWLSLQPDLQRVVRPGLDRAAKDATVSGIRMEAHFEF